MIRSMTGFGSAERSCERWLLRAEVRSVNHRDMQVTFRLPEAFHLRELDLQKLIEERVSRGHLYLSLTCELREDATDVLLDRSRVAAYVRELVAVAEEAGIEPHLDLAALLKLPGALKDLSTDEELRESLWADAAAATRGALDGLIEMRRAEGGHLAAQLREICGAMAALTDQIEETQGSFVADYRDRLRERINRLLDGAAVSLNEETLAREVAVYADRCDVSEEIARLRSHLGQFEAALDSDDAEPVGRKMEFIGQEMLRETGTIAAKVPAGRQVSQVLELKTAVERLREQVRNVE